MNLKQVTKDTSKVLTSYLTYQAARIVIAQLSETNPPLAYWLSQFSSQSIIQDGENYIRALLQEKQDLGFRIMTVREHLAQEILDFLPEMTRTGIQEANMDHRRQHLERITQFNIRDSVSDSATIPEEPAQDSTDIAEPSSEP